MKRDWIIVGVVTFCLVALLVVRVVSLSMENGARIVSQKPVTEECRKPELADFTLAEIPPLPWLPNLKLTPGKVTAGWTLADTKRHGGTQEDRHVDESLKKAVWARYQYDKLIGPYEEHAKDYEVDHLIPNCLGGASVIENLWAQPYTGKWNAHVKDRLEMHVRSQVIAGKITLEQGQKMFTPDWTKVYITEGLPQDKESGGVPLEEIEGD